MPDSESPKKAKIGRKPHAPTEVLRKKVRSYAAVGIPQQDIARVMRMSINTLRKHYIDELELGSIEANAMIGGALYNRAIGGDTGCLVWWTKTRMGWSEKREDATDADVAPVTRITYIEEDARHDD